MTHVSADGVLVRAENHRGRELAFVFSFKQKTAYEVGLGIPLNRSSDLIGRAVQQVSEIMRQDRKSGSAGFRDYAPRSEERRVGKEWRSRGKADNKKRKAREEEDATHTQETASEADRPGIERRECDVTLT